MTGKRVLVTGASRPTGIGAAIAHALATRGEQIAVHYRSDRTAAEKVVAALPGDGHAVVSADLADPDATSTMVDEAISLLGGIDILINNSATHVEHPIDKTSYAEWRDIWRRTLDINLVGAANTSWCVVHHLLNRPEGPAGGRIVMVGSRGANRGEPDVPAYGASKAGMHSLAQSLAASLGPYGIAVTAVAPGFTRTDATAELLDGPEFQSVLGQHPLGRVATPAEIAAAVAWLTLPEAEWATGAVLDLNGASYLH